MRHAKNLPLDNTEGRAWAINWQILQGKWPFRPTGLHAVDMVGFVQGKWGFRYGCIREGVWIVKNDANINSLRPRQNGRLFADDTFKCIFLNENIRISTKNSLKFVPKVLINNIPALVLIMAWRRPGDKPLSEPMLVRSLMHICVTRPQWVNRTTLYSVMCRNACWNQISEAWVCNHTAKCYVCYNFLSIL